MSNRDAVAQFFASKGYNYNSILGILGNAEDESGYSPTAYSGNPGTGYGLFQWMPGGRWPVLQQWASANRMDPYSLNTQLQFAWHEIQTRYQSMLPQNLNRAGSPAAAATQWANDFEGAAENTFQLRANIANRLASEGYRPPAYNDSEKGGGPIPDYANSYQGTAGGGGGSSVLTADDYTSALPDLAALVTQIPELKSLLDHAIATDQAKPDFIQAVETSGWWKTHSQTIRANIGLKVTDPATWRANFNQTVGQIHNAAKQLGIPLRFGVDDVRLANQAMNLGWQQSDIEHAVAGLANFIHVKTLAGMHGQMAQLTQQLSQMNGQYGQSWAPFQIAYRANQILRGNTTMDSYKQLLINQAKSMFPGLAQQLDQGLTVADAAQPYQQTMSQLLELDPATVKITDPLIRRALQGAADSKGIRTSTPVAQFEDQVRSDPRWQYTQNAKDTMSTALVHIGQDFGFGV